MVAFQERMKYLLIAVALIGLGLAFPFLEMLLDLKASAEFYALVGKYQGILVGELGINRYLANILAVPFVLLLAAGSAMALSFDRRRRRIGHVLIVVFFVCFNALMYEGSRLAREQDRREFLRRYVNVDIDQARFNSRLLLLAARGEGPGASESIVTSTAALLAALGSHKGYEVSTSAFTRRFFDEGLFGKVWAGDAAIIEQLRLREFAAGFVLAKIEISSPMSSTVGSERMTTVHGKLVLASEIGNTNSVTTKLYEASGAGFSPDSAASTCARKLVETAEFKGWSP